jgi:hypothetical protein
LAAGILEVQDANSIAHLPRTAAFRTDLHHDSCGLMRGYYRQLSPKLAMDDLEIRVAEASGVHLDQEFIVLGLGNVDCYELIWFVVLSTC